MLSTIIKLNPLAKSSSINLFSTTACCCNNKWRESKGLSGNPNSFGPLTNLPDYTFIDGRPTPIGSNMMKRLEKQKQTAMKMVRMCKELDFAKERFIRMKEDKIKKEKEILDNQYKPKGHLLLKK